MGAWAESWLGWQGKSPGSAEVFQPGFVRGASWGRFLAGFSLGRGLGDAAWRVDAGGGR